MEDVREAVTEWKDVLEWVLQRYVERPLLIGGHKFHLRVYVLVAGCLSVYLYEDAFVLLAARKFPGKSTDAEGESASVQSQLSHITNTCTSAAVLGDKFEEHRHVRFLSELPWLLEKWDTLPRGDGPAAVARVYDGMRTALAALFGSFRGQFERFMPLANAFELFGVDFLVDEDMHPWLLEFNPGPDMGQARNRLQPLMQAIVDDTVDTMVQQRDWADPARRLASQTREPRPVDMEESVPGLRPRPLRPFDAANRKAPCWKAGEGRRNGWDCVFEEVWVGSQTAARE